MTTGTCIDFIKQITKDTSNIVTSDNRIVKLFNNYNKDGDDLIKLDEFMQFYIDHSKTKPDTVWQNLRANNVGDNLKPMPDN